MEKYSTHSQQGSQQGPKQIQCKKFRLQEAKKPQQLAANTITTTMTYELYSNTDEHYIILTNKINDLRNY